MASLDVRKAKQEDADVITSMLADTMYLLQKRFGDVHITTLIETSFIALSVLDEAGSIIGFASFSNYPSPATPGIPKHNWEAWIKEQYNESRLNFVNTLWLTMFHSEPLRQSEVCEIILSTVLQNLPEIDCICLVLPENTSVIAPLDDFFHPAAVAFTQLSDDNDADEDASDTRADSAEMELFVCLRKDTCPKLTVRVGKVEDNDDLDVALANKNLTTMATDGEYFIAGLMEKQDADHKMLVAEANGQIVGLVYLTSDQGDCQAMADNFDISDFGDFFNSELDKNAFQIRMFFLDDAFMDRAIDIFKVAFEQFPDHEYCYITLPFHTTSEDVAFMQYFTPAKVKINAVFPEALFVLTRRALQVLIHISGRQHNHPSVEVLDLEKLQSVAMTSRPDRNLEVEREVIEALNSGAERGASAVTFTSEGTVVGIMVVETQFDAHLLRLLFDADPHIIFHEHENLHRLITELSVRYAKGGATAIRTAARMPIIELQTETSTSVSSDGQLLITRFYMDPHYMALTKLFIREALRKTRKTVAFYGCKSDSRPHSLVRHLYYFSPRNQIEIINHHTDNTPNHIRQDQWDVVVAERNSKPESQFAALWGISTRLLCEEKIAINRRLIVVGGSETGLGFINELITIPYLTFNFITLLSPDGVPVHPSMNKLSFHCNQMTLTDKNIYHISNYHGINFVQAKLKDINPQTKVVHASNNELIQYDYLLLATGRQYKLPKKYNVQPLPKSGIFELGNGTDWMDTMRNFLQKVDLNDELTSIVVYGSNLDAYSALQTLISSFGIPPSKLALVCPEDISVFNDENIDAKMEIVLDEQGIKKYRGFAIERILLDEASRIANVHIKHVGQYERDRQKNIFDIPCAMLLYCDQKNIDEDLLKIVYQRSLVFDGRLVVETNFQTTNPFIFSAGPVAAFSRRYGDSEMMEHFSSNEIGQRVARYLLGIIGVPEFEAKYKALLSPSATVETAAANDQQSLDNRKDEGRNIFPPDIPKFTAKIYRRCVIPSGLHFFQCHLPLWSIKADSNCKQRSTDLTDRYLRLHIDNEGTIRSVSYFGKGVYEANNFSALVGLPVAYCNGIAQRFDDNLVTDLFSFLRENWAMGLFYDRFTAFKQNIGTLSQTDEDTQAIREAIAQQIRTKGRTSLTANEQRSLLASAIADRAKHAIERRLIQFLAVNEKYLPAVFCVPKLRKM